MPKHKYTLLYYIGIPLAFLLLLAACDTRVVYNHYEHTSSAGWEKNDVLAFSTKPMTQDGNYIEEVGLRITTSYPFTQLTLVIEQTILPAHTLFRDTLNCDLINEKGIPEGPGISHFQYRFPLKALPLAKGDQLKVVVRHDMKREILPGISDVGIRLIREK